MTKPIVIFVEGGVVQHVLGPDTYHIIDWDNDISDRCPVCNGELEEINATVEETVARAKHPVTERRLINGKEMNVFTGEYKDVNVPLWWCRNGEMYCRSCKINWSDDPTEEQIYAAIEKMEADNESKGL